MTAGARAVVCALAVTCALASAGCGASAADVVQARAVRELRCPLAELRLQSIGELRVLALPDRPVALFEAHGCDQWQEYACVTHGGVTCARAITELPYAPAHPALERALSLLRGTARARCPASALRVEQESETLFGFEACDGAWLYHCRARGCVRLGAGQGK